MPCNETLIELNVANTISGIQANPRLILTRMNVIPLLDIKVAREKGGFDFQLVENHFRPPASRSNAGLTLNPRGPKNAPLSSQRCFPRQNSPRI